MTYDEVLDCLAELAAECGRGAGYALREAADPDAKWHSYAGIEVMRAYLDRVIAAQDQPATEGAS